MNIDVKEIVNIKDIEIIVAPTGNTIDELSFIDGALFLDDIIVTDYDIEYNVEEKRLMINIKEYEKRKVVKR